MFMPLQGTLNWPDAKHICGDLHENAPPRTMENLNSVNKRRQAEGL